MCTIAPRIIQLPRPGPAKSGSPFQRWPRSSFRRRTGRRSWPFLMARKKSREARQLFCFICGRMHFLARLITAALAVAFVAGCSTTPPAPAPDPAVPGRAVLRQAAARLTAIVISGKDELSPWVESRFTQGQGPDDADGGSAVPISPDGYFITADHVLSR